MLFEIAVVILLFSCTVTLYAINRIVLRLVEIQENRPRLDYDDLKGEFAKIRERLWNIQQGQKE